MRANYAYSRPEKIADLFIHVLGLGFGVGAATMLFRLGRPEIETRYAIPLALYAFGLLAMLSCSALYNLTTDPTRKALFRRFDHTAIFVMIAGTYSPYCMIGLRSTAGNFLLLFVWVVALTGAAVKLLWPGRFERVSVAGYLLLGWCGLVAFGYIPNSFPAYTMRMLLVGGGLYSTGVVFHLWTKLRFHNALWHLFVLMAAVAHFLSIARLVEMAE